MTLASWFSSLRRSRRRLGPTWTRRDRPRASRRRASFEGLENRSLLSSVSFIDSSESESAGTEINIPVALSNDVTTIGFDWPGPVGLAYDRVTGNLYVNQSDDAGTVSKVTPAGTISTFANGFHPDPLDQTAGDLAVDSFGDLYVANVNAQAVNVVTPAGVVSTFTKLTSDPFGLAIDSHDTLCLRQRTRRRHGEQGVEHRHARRGHHLRLRVRQSDGPGLRRGWQPLRRQHRQRHGEQGDARGRGHPLRLRVRRTRRPGRRRGWRPLRRQRGRRHGEGGDARGRDATTVTSGLTKPDGLAFDPAGNLFVAEYGGIGTVSKFSKTVTVPFTLGGTAVSGVDYSGVTASPLTFGIGQTTLGHHRHAPLRPRPQPDADIHPGHAHGRRRPGQPVGQHADHQRAPERCSSAPAARPSTRAPARSAYRSRSRAAATDTVTVPFTLGGTAVSGIAFSGVTASPLTFGVGQTTADITGTLLSDPGPSQTLTLTLGTPTGGRRPGQSLGQHADHHRAGGGAVQHRQRDRERERRHVQHPGDRLGHAHRLDLRLRVQRSPYGLAFDAAGNLYVANAGDDTVSKVTPAGVVSTFASGFDDPVGLAFDAAGNLYVANAGDNTVSKVTPAGTVSHLRLRVQRSRRPGLRRRRQPLRRQRRQRHGEQGDARGGGQHLRHRVQRSRRPGLRPAGNLYVANNGNDTVSKVTPAGVVSTFASGFNGPIGLAFDAAGNLYVADQRQRHGERGDARGGGQHLRLRVQRSRRPGLRTPATSTSPTPATTR